MKELREIVCTAFPHLKGSETCLFSIFLKFYSSVCLGMFSLVLAGAALNDKSVIPYRVGLMIRAQACVPGRDWAF